MSIETELKLRMTPEHLAKLRRHALFRKHQITAPVTRRLYNVYYDTPKLQLQKNRMALRLRRVAGVWLQTLKGGGQVLGGLHQRHEWEVPVPSGSLDFSGLDESVWGEYLPAALRSDLQSVFITDFSRSSRLLEWQGAVIEVCMDHGVVKTDAQSTPICEVELELKSGENRQLFELARALLDIVPFELEMVSKAELGYRMLSGHIVQPVKGTIPKLVCPDRLTNGLQTLIWSCLQHLQGNLRGAMAGKDPEYLHQMRIALRRLRVVLRMAGKVCRDEELDSLRVEFSSLGAMLGSIREWDVFIDGLALLPEHAGLQVMRECSEMHRDECCAALHMRARWLQHLLLQLAIWMSGPYWQKAENGAPYTCDFAAHHLNQLYRRYTHTPLHGLDAERLHELRIHAKKLRYSAEFFACLFDAKKARSFIAALGEVQETLGQINDIAVARRQLEKLTANLAVDEGAIAFVGRSLDKKLSKKIKLLEKHAQVFDKRSAFWEIKG
ncbi:MAG: CHAD domain-containing protein [Gallionella sp.]|jgi:inorganic triphosphatase YgiF